MKFRRSLLFCFALCLLGASAALAEDIALRQEAIRLLERADAVGTPVHLPNLQRTNTFRVFTEGGVKEGTFTRTVDQHAGRREEITYGDYHLLNVIANGRFATDRSQRMPPREVLDLLRLTPTFKVHFDETDVIQAINNRDVDGRPARCVIWVTVTGEKQLHGELCVEKARGVLLTSDFADERIEQYEFFEFAGETVPARIEYYTAGRLHMEIRQTIEELSEIGPDVLATPPNALLLGGCVNPRPAFGKVMPQPKPGTGGAVADVRVAGIVQPDGLLHDAIVTSSERPDLHEEALQVAQTWRFSPPLCDGKPSQAPVLLTLHFQGR